ncbi:MAG: cytochrome [Conexibacter sp.]|nr:cytochrome [Conexibacter sp.]
MSCPYAQGTTIPVAEDFQPLSLDFIRQPYGTLAELRERAPIHYLPDLDLWAITRWEDQVGAFGNFKDYSSRCVGVGPRPPAMHDVLDPEFLTKTFNAKDPPEHTVARKLASQAFRRARVDDMGPVTARRAHELIDGFAADGSGDLMEQFCVPLAMGVMVELLGFPPQDAHLLDGWGNDLTVLFVPKDPDAPDDQMAQPMPDEEWLERWTRLAAARAYFEELIEERLARPTGDLISGMVHARLEDGTTALNREHVVTHLVEFISAGKAAMADLIAQTVILFDAQPDVLEELRREPELWAEVCEEALRMRGNALGLLRVAMRDVEIGGHTLPKGSRVWLLASSANHDPEHFPEPGRFDLHRENVGDHLAFGRGIHKCIGSPLTRVTCTEALRVLYERLPAVRPVAGQELDYEPSLLAFLLRSLAVTW